MLGIISIFAASLLMGLSGALMPGPLLTVTINESLRRGRIAAPLLILGHAVLELGLVLAIFLGLGAIITLPVVKGSIGVIGGVFLGWMAWGIIREVLNKQLNLDLSGQAQNQGVNPLIKGITVSASNPYWSVWWATAGAGALMLAATKYGVPGALSFYCGHVSADFLWYTLIGTVVAKGKQFFTPILYRSVLGVCGVFLAGLAIYFLISGLQFFRLV